MAASSTVSSSPAALAAFTAAAGGRAAALASMSPAPWAAGALAEPGAPPWFMYTFSTLVHKSKMRRKTMGKFFRGMRVNPSIVAAVSLRLIVSRAASGTARSMAWVSTDVHFPTAHQRGSPSLSR